jgi:hypothetical protein
MRGHNEELRTNFIGANVQLLPPIDEAWRLEAALELVRERTPLQHLDLRREIENPLHSTISIGPAGFQSAASAREPSKPVVAAAPDAMLWWIKPRRVTEPEAPTKEGVA